MPLTNEDQLPSFQVSGSLSSIPFPATPLSSPSQVNMRYFASYDSLDLQQIFVLVILQILGPCH